MSPVDQTPQESNDELRTEMEIEDEEPLGGASARFKKPKGVFATAIIPKVGRPPVFYPQGAV